MILICSIRVQNLSGSIECTLNIIGMQPIIRSVYGDLMHCSQRKYFDSPLSTRPSSPCHGKQEQINTGQTMIKAIWNKNLEEVYNTQLSLPKNIQNLTVTGSKQNQMVSSVAGPLC